MDLEQHRYVGPTSQRKQIKYLFRIKESKEENLLQKMHNGENISQINREIIDYLNPVLPGFSLSQTIIKLPDYNSQSMGVKHILPMGMQNNWGDQMVVEDYQIQLFSLYIHNAKFSSSDYNR
jgi:hypothetical protein